MKTNLVKSIAILATIVSFATAAIAQPVLGTISPNQGPKGTTVTINGTKLNQRTNGSVYTGTNRDWSMYYFNGSQWTPLSFTLLSPTQMRATIPQSMVSSKFKLQGGNYVKYTTNTFTVVAPTGLNFANNSQYALVELKLNGTRLFPLGQWLAPHNNATFNVAPGTYTMQGALGTVSSGNVNVWFTANATVTVSNGNITNIQWSRLTVGELLAGSTPNVWKRYNGYYFDANSNYHTSTLYINSNNSYQLYYDNTLGRSGQLVVTNWPDYAYTVNFTLGAGGPQANTSYPFGTVYARVGPASWSWIQFTRQ